MSLTLKLGSLVVRTLSKPIASYIKHAAREHDRFRHVCVQFAQRLHRVDMMLRLNLLKVDTPPAKASSSTSTSTSSPNSSPSTSTSASTPSPSHSESKRVPRIRPLSEAKAIETGANFISESFMFLVAGSALLFEAWRSRRKEGERRENVAERLAALEELSQRLEAQLKQNNETSRPAATALVIEESTPVAS